MNKRIEHKIIDGVKCKRCGTCKEWKSLDYFNKNKNNWDGLKRQCKSCQKQYNLNHAEEKRQYNKQYRIEHAKELKQQRKQYYTDNTEKIKQQQKQYRINHAEKIKQYCKQYRIDHAECIKQGAKQYRIDNTEKIKQYFKQPALYETYVDRLCWCEEIQRNGKVFEVKCAYCGKWMRPTNRQVRNRIKAINGNSSGELRFYCSENCKLACPIYRQRVYSKDFKKATSREVVPLLRQLVLERDNYTCQKCGATNKEAQLHVHHEKSYTLNKIMANDPDSCITLCKECHKEVHQQEGCKYNDLKCGKIKISETGIYWKDGWITAESGNVKVYQTNYDIFLEIGPAHKLFALGSEIKDYKKQLGNKPFGNVLEIGLGLGVVSKYMLSLEKVKLLTTIEVNEDVIKTFNYLNNKIDKKHTILNLDGLDYVKQTDKKFDFIFLDYYSLLNEETLPHIEVMVYWCKKILKPGREIVGWYDRYTPDNFTDWFNEIFDCNMVSG